MPTYPALAFRSRFAAAAAIFDADFLVVRAGVFLMASNIACFKFGGRIVVRLLNVRVSRRFGSPRATLQEIEIGVRDQRVCKPLI
jgi:hypothetical protein